MLSGRFYGYFERDKEGLEGQMIQPTNKKFQTEFCTVATWKAAKITEERQFYEVVRVMTQIAAMP